MVSLVGSAIADRPILGPSSAVLIPPRFVLCPPSSVLFRPLVPHPAHRPARLGKAGLQFFLPLVVVDIASGPVFVDHQQPSAPLLSSSAPAPAPRFPAALVNGLNVPKKQSITASGKTSEVLTAFRVVECQDIGLQLIDDAGDFLMLGFELPQPFGGLLHLRQQDGSGGGWISGRDRFEIPPAEPVLVALVEICVNIASELTEGVLKLRLDRVAGEEYFGDGGNVGRVQGLASHQTYAHKFIWRLPSQTRIEPRFESAPGKAEPAAAGERALKAFDESARVIRVFGEPRPRSLRLIGGIVQ